MCLALHAVLCLGCCCCCWYFLFVLFRNINWNRSEKKDVHPVLIATLFVCGYKHEKMAKIKIQTYQLNVIFQIIHRDDESWKRNQQISYCYFDIWPSRFAFTYSLFGGNWMRLYCLLFSSLTLTLSLCFCHYSLVGWFTYEIGFYCFGSMAINHILRRTH